MKPENQFVTEREQNHLPGTAVKWAQLNGREGFKNFTRTLALWNALFPWVPVGIGDTFYAFLQGLKIIHKWQFI